MRKRTRDKPARSFIDQHVIDSGIRKKLVELWILEMVRKKWPQVFIVHTIVK